MDNDEKYDEILSFFKNHKIRENSAKRVFYEEDLIKLLIIRTNFSEEKVREIFFLYKDTIKQLHKENPEALKNYFNERYNGEFIFNDTDLESR